MRKSGWQQPPVVRRRKVECPHFGLIFATLTLTQHPEGHRWLCTCGQEFVVVSDGGRNKRFDKV